MKNAPDMCFVQTSRKTVRITASGYNLDGAIVAFRQERAWNG